MLVIKTIKDIKKFPHPVVVMGNFDGVHPGHQKMIKETISHTQKVNGTSVVITFDPNTKVFFGFIKESELLQTQEQKIEKLKSLGVDVVIVLPFTKELSQMTAEEFIKDFLVGKIGIHKIIVGYDTTFGRDKKGNKENLIKYGKKYNFSVSEVAPLTEHSQIISSSNLRKNL